MNTLIHTIEDFDSLRKALCAPDIHARVASAASILVQLFTAKTDSQWLIAVGEIVTRNLPGAVVVGATTVGEVVAGKTLTGSNVLILSFFSESSLTPIAQPCAPGAELAAGWRLAESIAAVGADVVGVLLLATTATIDTSQLLRGLEEGGGRYPVFGGGAADNASLRDSQVLLNTQCLSAGAVAVAFMGEALHIQAHSYLGWQPLSREMTITEVDGMLVKKVDNEPAFDVYRRYLGIVGDDGFFLNALEFPFLLERQGNHYARVPVAVGKEGELQFIADIQPGEKFCIGYGNPSLIVANAYSVRNAMQDFAPQAIFLYTCGCRRFLMQHDSDQETLPFQDIAPTAGFYTYGEFFGHGKKMHLLNSTMVAVGIREGSPASHIASRFEEQTTTAPDGDRYAADNLRVLSRLLYFIQAVTTELSQANSELLTMAVTDKLTNIYNRTKLDTVLENESKRAGRTGKPLSVALLDVDHFKQVNDSCGHAIGDMVLVGIADVLKREVRQTDTIGRWGGEEFLVILPDTDAEGALRVAEKIRCAIAATRFPVIGQKTVSLGVAVQSEDDTLANLLSRADVALYEAKFAGRNRVKLKGT